MKKTFLILTSTLGAIAIVIMLTAGGDSKFSRGYSEYEQSLKEAVSQDKELAKHLSQSREVINGTNTSIYDLKSLLTQLNNYYSSATEVAETIKDEELKAQILQKINGSKERFEVKQQNANNKKEQVELLLQELTDLNTAISILATLPIQQENEKEIKKEEDKVAGKKSDVKKQILNAKTRME